MIWSIMGPTWGFQMLRQVLEEPERWHCQTTPPEAGRKDSIAVAAMDLHFPLASALESKVSSEQAAALPRTGKCR